MKTRTIGNTGIEVTEVSFGCASIGNLYRKVSDADAEAVLQTAWDAGIRYLDTAPHYGRGLSETRLGRFLQGRDRGSYALSSKLGRVLSPSPQPIAEADSYIEPLPNLVSYDYSGDGIRASFEQTCGRLGVTRLDIAYVHDIGAYTHGAEVNAGHMEAFFGSGYEALVKLKEAGRIGAFGLGVNECQVCLDVMDHGPIDVILLAGRLTLLDRSAIHELGCGFLVVRGLDRVRVRLGQLSEHLGDAEWLDGAFSAGDLMMVSVLLRLRMSGILAEFPRLAAYVARGEARPAYQRAFAAQLAINAPAG